MKKYLLLLAPVLLIGCSHHATVTTSTYSTPAVSSTTYSTPMSTTTYSTPIVRQTSVTTTSRD